MFRQTERTVQTKQANKPHAPARTRPERTVNNKPTSALPFVPNDSRTATIERRPPASPPSRSRQTTEWKTARVRRFDHDKRWQQGWRRRHCDDGRRCERGSRRFRPRPSVGIGGRVPSGGRVCSGLLPPGEGLAVIAVTLEDPAQLQEVLVDSGEVSQRGQPGTGVAAH